MRTEQLESRHKGVMWAGRWTVCSPVVIVTAVPPAANICRRAVCTAAVHVLCWLCAAHVGQCHLYFPKLRNQMSITTGFMVNEFGNEISGE
jgi:hypothetical protein